MSTPQVILKSTIIVDSIDKNLQSKSDAEEIGVYTFRIQP